MTSDSVNEFIRKVEGWATSLPSNKINIFTNKNSEQNDEYLVDCEIKISPKNPRSLGINIWLSGNAIGFFIMSYAHIARLISSNSISTESGLACAGSEPITRIDVDSLLEICKALSSAQLDIYAGTVFGYLKGVYVSIKIKNNGVLDSSIGYPKSAIKYLSKISVAKLVAVPYEPW